MTDRPPTDRVLRARLEARATGRWELYRKSAESRELVASPGRSSRARRKEEGWAARWWENGGPRFAAGSSPAELLAAMEEAARVSVPDEPLPEWPARRSPAPPEDAGVLDAPPELFGALSDAVAAASRGECALARLALRHGRVTERVENAASLDVAQRRLDFDGVATAIARRGSRAHEGRVAFRGASPPDVEPLARRLSDAATLPLAEPGSPPPKGQWLLDPAVAAALLAAVSPIFTLERPPRWIVRGKLAGPEVSIADDATADSPFDGEGVPTRRVLLVDGGQLAGTLLDLRSARRVGRPSTGHGVRSSFRTPPRAGPRRIFFASSSPSPPADLLASVTRGLYASALTGPVRVDLENDRFEIAFTGIAVVAGRARGPVAGSRATGRLSELLRRIRAVSADVQFFPAPFLAGAPTILVERASFD